MGTWTGHPQSPIEVTYVALRVIGHGGDGLTVGLDHLGGLVQPQQLYDSMSRHGGE